MASGSAEGSPGPSRTSRASSTRPFIGHSCQDVPPGGLASQKDVLRLIAYFREQEKAQFKPVAEMCCNQNRLRETLCETEDGCLQRGETCLLFKVKLKWLQAGIATLADQGRRGRLCKLQEKYQHILFPLGQGRILPQNSNMKNSSGRLNKHLILGMKMPVY